jgi:glycosyltransferase involved in cell wall biosynthesis
MPAKPHPKVVIIYKSLPQYRRDFYERMRSALAERGIDFHLIYGQPTGPESKKEDSVDIGWATRVHNRCVRIGRKELLWQPVTRLVMDADLVIVEQASRLLVNYWLQLNYLIRKHPRLALWGHGKNFQGHDASRIGELVKRYVSQHVHWWFAYNDKSAEVVQRLGVPPDRISSVQNAIDTRGLVLAHKSLSQDKVEHLRVSLGLSGKNVGIFAGGMYEEKRLGFLLAACERIRDAVPDFEMVFLGSGPQVHVIRDAAARCNWIKYVGPKFGDDKVPYFALAKVFLMPGLVGLAILDCFALEVPLVTSAIDYHSPEIAYLENGVNGVCVAEHEDAQAYADAVTMVLKDDVYREKLRNACRASAERYTLEEMVERFGEGVVRALA